METDMADLLILAFPDEASAMEARTAFVRMQKDYLVEMEDAVVISRESDSGVRLHQAVNMTAAGALGGTVWGGLIGLLFLNPLLGAAMGASAGAISGFVTDLGIDDAFLTEVGETLSPGTAALGVLVRTMTTDRVLAGLEPWAGKALVLRTSLSAEQEGKLAQALAVKDAA
jgi:uncharacterized membrane protein